MYEPLILFVVLLRFSRASIYTYSPFIASVVYYETMTKERNDLEYLIPMVWKHIKENNENTVKYFFVGNIVFYIFGEYVEAI